MIQHDPSSPTPCGWRGSVKTFQATSDATLIASLEEWVAKSLLMAGSQSQIAAWRECVKVLRTTFTQLLTTYPSAGGWEIIFEYALPRERGRRPDVVILAADAIIVLEFKGYTDPIPAHLDQVYAYARDIANYHAASHEHKVTPVLVLTRALDYKAVAEGVYIVSPSELSLLIQNLAGHGRQIDPDAWLDADYAPLPTLVAAARTIFNHEPLPQIRRAQSAGIPETIAELMRIASQARELGQRHLALVTGVPGAGKTLVGLQFVYDYAAKQGAAPLAVFLSGNGPLVKVLQYALKSSVFVQDVHGFLMQYGGATSRVPNEHIWVYDEAQRAWDGDKVMEKRGHSASEPEDFLRIGRRTSGWALMVGLIGEGQEIHLGEEAGLGQWNKAIEQVGGNWVVHCPAKLVPLFTAADRVEVSSELDLTQSLRSHLAEDVQRWVALLLEARPTEAAELVPKLTNQGFAMYATRDLVLAERYVRERYQGEEDKRYGLLASSKAKNLSRHGIQNEYNYTKNFREGPWYNDPPSAPRSSCQLHDVATEFACQGLELDFPIISWGDDLLWKGGHWQSLAQPRSHAHNPHQLRINSYRVLLSRGRDGFIVFVPDERVMDETYGALLAAGLSDLKSA